MNEKISDYITFPRTFENYKWYKPLLVFILTTIIMLIFEGIIVFLLYHFIGKEFILTVFGGGIDSLNSATSIFLTDLIIILFIPSIYIASKIVKDRPFSSYSSSRGGWNFKLYLKALIIPLILHIAYMAVEYSITGTKGPSNISIAFLIVILISVPLQSIAEEYLFRGLFMQTFGSWFKIPVLAIVLQAIIFTMGHGYNSLGSIETLTSGLIWGFLTWKTDGIEVSSALHSANNMSIGLFTMLGLYTSTSSPQLTSVLPSVIFIIALSFLMYYIGKKTDWFGEIQKNT